MIHRSAIVVALLVFGLGGPSFAAKKVPAEKWITSLQRAEYFSVWGIGYAGTPTANERTFRAAMRLKPTADDAQRLINDGTPAAKIYGLLALKKLSPREFEKLAPKFFRDHAGVNILSGCDLTPRTRSTATLVKQISAGKII